ncbi:MAG: 2TM domain-containing protein [Lewinellaceae bacterium]|nr:2TM domain-containing protein [Saprospiraceae bacterium]MCB9339214.1 2TM domain-containing protein [Lewinellaceae bacterium]
MKEHDPNLYNEARRRVKEKAKFYKHLYAYLIFNIVFFVMALFRGRPFAPLAMSLFWGIGLAFHYLKVFGLPGSGVLSKEWEDTEVQKEMQKMTGKKSEIKEEEKLDLKELRKNYDDSELV